MQTEQRFKADANRVANTYKNHCTYFTDWHGVDQQGRDRMETYIDAAWQLYYATRNRQLEFTVLGGSTIRTAKKYLRSFGVTGISGLQEKKAKMIRAKEDGRRIQRVLHPRSNHRPDREFVPMAGYGSILSEKLWSPILNDALIVGAAVKRTDLVVGLTSGEMARWRAHTHTINAQGARTSKITKRKVAESKFSKEEVKESWKEFLRNETQMFFCQNGRFARVFAREVLGLALFGYEPVFSWFQWGFRPAVDNQDVNTASTHYNRRAPSLPNYVNGLAKLNFHSIGERDLLMVISDFLFGDDTALV